MRRLQLFVAATLLLTAAIVALLAVLMDKLMTPQMKHLQPAIRLLEK